MNNHPQGVQRNATVRVHIQNVEKVVIQGVVLSADNIGMTVAYDPMTNEEQADTTKVDGFGVPVAYRIVFLPWTAVGYVEIGRTV